MKIATDRKFKNPDDILQYEGMVNTIVAGYFKSGIPRDELVSEAWIGVIRALQTFNESKGMKQSSWIYLNIKYSIRTAVAMRGRYVERTILDSDTFVLNTDSSSHRTSPNENDLSMDEELLYRAISKLSERKKTILVRVYLRGETQQSVATSLGISQSWCSRLLKSVLEELRGNVRKKEEKYEISA